MASLTTSSVSVFVSLLFGDFFLVLLDRDDDGRDDADQGEAPATSQ